MKGLKRFGDGNGEDELTIFKYWRNVRLMKDLVFFVRSQEVEIGQMGEAKTSSHKEKGLSDRAMHGWRCSPR